MNRIKMLLNTSGLIKEGQYNGEECYLIPTILMTEGVHNSYFYDGETFEKFVGSWNGRPVTANHPTENGKDVSANKPEVLEKFQIGWMFDIFVENNSLKGTAYISKKKVKEISPILESKIQNSEMIEVSTGVYVETDKESGVWKNEEFNATVTIQAPDHLAYLETDKGACSIEDGAGAPRINKQEEKKLDERLKRLFTNQLSHNDVHSKLQNLIESGDYILDVYSDHFVFEQVVNSGMDDISWKLMKQAYSIDASENIEFNGEPIEVQLKREYVPKTNGKDNDMAENKELQTNEEVVEVVETPETVEEPEEVEEVVEETEEDVFNRVIEKHPELKRAINREKKYIEEIRNELKANKQCKLTNEQIDKMDIELLENMKESFKVEASYAGRNTAAPETNKEDDNKVPECPTLNFEND